MQDGKICTLAAIIMVGLIEISIMVGLIEISLILTHQDGTLLALVVAVIAGLGGYVLLSPLNRKKGAEYAKILRCRAMPCLVLHRLLDHAACREIQGQGSHAVL